MTTYLKKLSLLFIDATYSMFEYIITYYLQITDKTQQLKKSYLQCYFTVYTVH